MSLLSFDPNFRRLWMFPRNIRRIYPWKMAQILSLLQEQVGTSSWERNQSLQNQFCKALEVAGLKVEGVQRDPHSGGPRTYFAQLKCLGLVFTGNDSNVYFTQAGSDLIEGEQPLPVIQRLLLRHQYPSFYSERPNVKIDPRMKVKPFLFIIKLLRDSRINYLTSNEIMVPVIYGHNHDCLEICINKILQLRNGASLDSVINSVSDLYTRRNQNPALPEAVGVSSNIHDIANTCKNYLQAACLISVEDQDGSEHIYQTDNARAIIEEELARIDSFINPQELGIENFEENFQRRYGAWDTAKDTRRLIPSVSQISPGTALIKGMFFEYLGGKVVSDYPEDFVGQMVSGFGFEESLVASAIEPFLSKSLDIFESTFINLSVGGTSTALDFEKAACELFEKRLKFESQPTGQRRRPAGRGGYADIFAVALDHEHCALIDTKASNSYSLSSEDHAKMISNYIPNYHELCEGRPLDLEFISYVAGGFSNINNKLQEIQKERDVPASAVTAKDLLTIANSADITEENQPVLREFFSQSKQLYSKDLKL